MMATVTAIRYGLDVRSKLLLVRTSVTKVPKCGESWDWSKVAREPERQTSRKKRGGARGAGCWGAGVQHGAGASLQGIKYSS